MATAAYYRAVGVALAAGAVVAFSFRPILIKVAYGYVRDPVTLIALRMVFSLPFFLAAAFWRPGAASQPPISRRDLRARILAARIPNAKLYVINDGHLFLVTRAGEVAPVVRRFLTEEAA